MIKDIVNELNYALYIADKLSPELREALFKRLIRDYIEIELAEHFSYLKKAG